MKSAYSSRKRCGLIINPIAGMGGAVGLKGTDGPHILKQAIELGALPRAENRALETLHILKNLREHIEIVTGPGSMGEQAALKAGFSPKIVGSLQAGTTTPADTIGIARSMARYGTDIILFAGGDGTARDIYTGIGSTQPCIGIPAGVKIHSAVFAQNPVIAGEIASLFLQSRIKHCMEAEVIDLDEESYRKEILQTRLFGYLSVPAEKSRLQRSKARSAGTDSRAHEAIAHDIAESMDDRLCYLIGAGTTLRPLMQLLGLDFSLLGVDIIQGGALLAKDAPEKKILETISGKKFKILVTPVGGQGYIFGRGNLQLSPAVLNTAGKQNIVIAAAPGKLQNLRGRPMLTDTGDRDTDQSLAGIYRVITGYHQSTMYRVEC